jgi:hypothetical protein
VVAIPEAPDTIEVNEPGVPAAPELGAPEVNAPGVLGAPEVTNPVEATPELEEPGAS